MNESVLRFSQQCIDIDFQTIKAKETAFPKFFQFSIHDNQIKSNKLIITRMWSFLNSLTPMCIAHTNQILRSCKF